MEGELPKQFFSKKTADYSYSIVFFLTFSFFTWFVIRPNLATVFSLQKELHDLKLVDAEYNEAINKIIATQSIFETIRNDLYVLDEALPAAPKINKTLDDLKQIASSSGISFSKMNISQVSFKTKQKPRREKRGSFTVRFETNSGFNDLKKFIELISNQRRLKTIKNLAITKDNKESTQSSTLKIELEVESYYL